MQLSLCTCCLYIWGSSASVKSSCIIMYVKNTSAHLLPSSPELLSPESGSWSKWGHVFLVLGLHKHGFKVLSSIFKDAGMWKWKMSTCFPSGIAIIQFKVMAWVSLSQGYWGFLQVESLQPQELRNGSAVHPAAFKLSSNDASAPGRDREGQLGPDHCTAILSPGPSRA